VLISTSRLKWLSFGGLFVFTLVFDRVRANLYPHLESAPGRLVLDIFVLTGGIFLLGLWFALVSKQEAWLERQSAELLSLHHAALDLGGELSLDTLLQKVVDGARGLIGARYGALAVIDREAQIEAFVVSGLSPAERDRLGAPPQGKGLLGVAMHDGERLRVAQIHRDARAAGFPPGHPPMTSLLAVPISCRSPFRGNLYLTDKLDESEFTVGDEATLERFSTQAANAIDAVHLHERLRVAAIEEERLRLAREMHDGVAQVLASVNARSQAIREHVRAGRDEEAITHLERLAADARAVHNEVRESILALRATASTSGISSTLEEYLDNWQDQTGIAVIRLLEGELRLVPEREVQVLRIAQEALANVHKHSGASQVRIELAREGEMAKLEISDDGRGFEPGRGAKDGRPHFGLLTMRERAQAVDAALDISTEPGKGTTVRLSVPLGRGAPMTSIRRTA
jgi:signal transduction histidine kinase